MLKSPRETDEALLRRYERIWAEEAAGCSQQEWPVRVSLGTVGKAELEESFAALCAHADELRGFAGKLGLEVEAATRQVGGTKQLIPSHVIVGSMDILAVALHKGVHFAGAKARASRMRQDFPSLTAEQIAALLRKIESVAPKDVDFDLACRAALWFKEHDAAGLSARQVPLVGFHAKWLDKRGRRALVAQLAEIDPIVLMERPPQVRFTYLDPAYRTSGGRRYDSWVVGDVEQLAYEPQVVVICENRDSALWFPCVEGGIAVMGDGFAGIGSVSQASWVQQACFVVYWGDMDASGLEILSGYRSAGVSATSMLMDIASYQRYARFGTNVDAHGKPIGVRSLLEAPLLYGAELELYRKLTDPKHSGPRRIEQERIPLEDALAALDLLQNGSLSQNPSKKADLE